MRSLILTLLMSLVVAGPAAARDYRPISDRAEFLALVEGRDLRLAMFGITLRVARDGSIRGTASGSEVSGSWSWEGGYFCRQMTWSDRTIPYNCQLVELGEPNKMRFTVDRGAGQSATFTLR